MTQPGSAAPQQSADKTKPPVKRRRRWWKILLALLLLTLLLVALAPALLSTGPGRRFVLGMADSRINGSVTADDWSLGWFSGIRVSKLRLASSDGADVLSVESVKIPAGLLALARSTKKLGDVEVTGPAANIVLYPDGTTNLQRLIKESTPASSVLSAPDERKPFGFDLKGNFRVSDGRISIRAEGVEKAFEVRKINASMGIASLNSPAQFTASARLGEASSLLSTEGSVAVSHDGAGVPEAVDVDVMAELDHLQLNEFQPLAAQYGILDRLSGAVSAGMRVKVHGTTSIESNATVFIDTLAMGGGLLGKDEPAFEKITLDFDLDRQGENFVINKFKLDSPVATAESSGTMSIPAPGRLPAGDVQFTTTVNLPALAQRFPHTLRLQEGLTITKGALTAEARLSSKDGVSHASIAMVIDGLTAVREGKTIALEKPISLATELSQSAQGVRIDRLELDSSFAQASGAGDAEKFDFTLRSDLTAALAEARKFVELGDFDVAGKLEAEAHIAASDPQKSAISVAAQVGDFSLLQGGKRLSEPKAQITLAATVAPATRTIALNDARLTLSSGQVTGKATVPDWAAPEKTQATIQGQFDIAKLLATLHDFALLPQGMTVDGTASFDLEVTGAQAGPQAGMTAEVTGLKVASPGKPPVEEEKVELTAKASFTPAKPGTAERSSLALDSVKVASGLLALQATARIDDLEKSRRLQADGTWAPNFDRIGPLLSAFTGQQIELAGNESREFHVKAELGSADLATLLRGLAAQAGVSVKRVAVMGIETGVMDAPLRFENGIGSITIDTTVNGGKLLLPLQVDAREKVAVATLPDNTPALAGVKITDQMADQLLSRFSPLFKGGVVSAGTIDLTLKQMRVPLASPVLPTATLEGEMSLKGVRMSSAGFVKEVLSAAGLDRRELLTLPDQTVAFSVRDGMLRQEPVTMLMGGYAIRLSGGMALADLRLDMTAEVPVTRELLGGRADLYELLKEESLKVPVTGTASRPEIARDAIAKSVGKLAESAGKKLLREKGTELLEELLNKRR